MEVEYGVKTTNKFLISEFTGEDDDIYDPSEILKKLIDSQLAEKNAAALKKKNAAQLPSVQQKKKITGSTAIFDKPFDKSRSFRSANNKENESSNSPRDGPRRFPRGGANQTPVRGDIARIRQPRPERTFLPPRFRQGGNDDQEFPQEKSRDSNNNNNLNESEVRSGGFGTGFGTPADGEETRQFGGGRQGRGGFNGPRPRFNNEGGGFRGGRGGGRGGFDNGAGGFGGGFGGRPRRQFDRQSGSDKTGVKHVDKRDGAGSHNWGSAADAVAEQLSSMDASDEAGVQPQTDNDPAANNETAGDRGTEEVQANVEQEPVQLTLDEWKAQQGAKAPPQFNVRRAGEGDKNPAWEKLRPLKKSGETNAKKKKQRVEQQVEEEEEEYEEDSRIVPVEIRFIGEPLRRGGRGRGGGGGMRGGRGRGDFGGPRGDFGRPRDFGGSRGDFGGQRDFGGSRPRDFGGPREFGQGRGDRQRDAEKTDEIPYKIDDETFPSLS